MNIMGINGRSTKLLSFFFLLVKRHIRMSEIRVEVGKKVLQKITDMITKQRLLL